MLERCLIILNGQNLYLHIRSLINPFIVQYRFDENEIENLYDWLVTQAIINTYNLTMSGHINVDRFPLQDTYRCIYDEVGYRIERSVHTLITGSYGIEFKFYERIRTLVTFDEIVITRRRTHI